MNQSNHFSTLNLLTMMSFRETLKIMESSLNGVVKREFQKQFEKDVRLSGLTEWTKHSRYLLRANLATSHKNSKFLACSIGYWDLNPNNLTGYPNLGILLEVSNDFNRAEDVISSMDRVIEETNEWEKSSCDDKGEGVWTWIAHTQNLSLLPVENQLVEIETYFLDSIAELGRIKQHFLKFGGFSSV